MASRSRIPGGDDAHARGPEPAAAATYLWGFLAARVLHSIFYIRSAQPHRTIAFAVGAVLMFVMLLSTLVAVV